MRFGREAGWPSTWPRVRTCTPPRAADAGCAGGRCRPAGRRPDRRRRGVTASHPAEQRAQPPLHHVGHVRGASLNTPDGVLLGASSGAVYGQSVVTLRPGDLLLLHTDGLLSGHSGTAAVDRLLGLAPRFGAARTAQDCVRTVVEEFGGAGREDDACVLVVKVTT
ncbi:SpoIIE family protein phosphatase [Streptomyces canarius]